MNQHSSFGSRICFGILGLMMVLTLSACGFHLRGSSQAARLNFKTMSIDPDTPFTPLQKILRTSLVGEQIQIVPATAKPDISLFLVSETLNQQTLAMSRTAEAQQYLLHYQLTFKVLNSNGQVLLPNSQIQVEREIAHDPNQTLAQNNEQAQLEAEMRRSAVQQLLLRLANMPAVVK